jgi:hypothetical protein
MPEDIRRLFLERSCALIGYPETWDSAAVAVIVAQRARFGPQEIIKNGPESQLQNTIVVTWNPVIATKTLDRTSFIKDNIKIINYTSLSELTNISNNFIIFDSLQEIIDSLKFVQDLLRKRNIVVILFTLGVTNYHFEEAKKYINGAYFFWSTFLEVSHHMQFVLHESYMTNEQEINYTLVRKEELDSSYKDYIFEDSQKICNILFSSDVRKVLGTPDEPSINTIIKSYTKSQPRLRRTTRGSIMEEDYIFDKEQFLLNAPKIKDLLAQLRLFPDMRHVIYTRYENYYGVKMLNLVLSSLSFKCYITASHIVEGYNRDKDPSILILSTSIPRTEGFFNVSHLHFLDSGYDFYHILLDSIFKYRLYTTFMCNLFVHNYICQKRGIDQSADTILYEMFVTYQNQILDTWEKTQKRGFPLVVGKNGYLSAMTK